MVVHSNLITEQIPKWVWKCQKNHSRLSPSRISCQFSNIGSLFSISVSLNKAIIKYFFFHTIQFEIRNTLPIFCGGLLRGIQIISIFLFKKQTNNKNKTIQLSVTSLLTRFACFATSTYSWRSIPSAPSAISAARRAVGTQTHAHYARGLSFSSALLAGLTPTAELALQSVTAGNGQRPRSGG